MEVATVMKLAEKLYAAKPTTAEGELALAAWRRCVYAVADAIEHEGVKQSFLIDCRA